MEFKMTTRISNEAFLLALRNANGNRHQTAIDLDLNLRSVQRRISRLKAEGVINHEPQIDGNLVRQSTLTNASGEITAQWDIRVPEKTQEAQIAMIKGFSSEVTPLPPQDQLPIQLEEHLLNQYTFSDSHIGLMVDDDFCSDLPQTEELIADCFEKMVEDSPRAENAILNILGDWFHFDSLLPMTPTSHNILFSNSHYADMVQSGVKIMRRLITSALYHHKNVTVVICEGNHDLASSLWLRIMMMALYESEPRVKFVDSEDPFYATSFGDVFLGYHHGHIKGVKKPEDLALLMATDYAPLWGQTTKRFLHTGHLHHFEEKQVTGALVSQHPTLAGMDNHTRRGGYRSGRAAVADTYSKLYGRVGKTIITPEMLLR